MTVNMIRYVCLSILLFTLPFACPGQCQEYSADLFDRLKAINGVYVKRIDPLPGFAEGFELAIVQPLDHGNPNGSKFTQRVFLSHRDFSKPVVLETEGYGVSWPKERELARILNANQIIVEHRYYESSTSNPVRWEYLTSWQAASDHHRIVEILKAIYPGKWVSCGRSKGGMAALFHRAYYPRDVDATVAYVAPIMLGPIDLRLKKHMSFAGGESTQVKIIEFQRTCLRRRAELLPMFNDLAVSQKLNFPIRIDEIFEWAVIRFPYTFLGGGHEEAEIPAPDTSAEIIFELLNGVFSGLTEKQLSYDAALYYQQFTELGYLSFSTMYLQDLLLWIKEPDFSFFVPADGRKDTFHKDAMLQVLDNLQNEGNNILYLYGENDIWTSCAVEISHTTNAVKIIAEGKGHKFNISDLKTSERELVYRSLKNWLGIELEESD